VFVCVCVCINVFVEFVDVCRFVCAHVPMCLGAYAYADMRMCICAYAYVDVSVHAHKLYAQCLNALRAEHGHLLVGARLCCVASCFPLNGCAQSRGNRGGRVQH